MFRYCLTIAFIGVISLLCSPVTPAQTTRTLTVRIDTVRLSACGAKSFLLGVGVGDIYVADSVVGMRVVLAWDRTSIDLEDQAIFSSETIGGQFPQRFVTKDAETATMVIEMGNVNLNPVAGTGKPLFFVKGIVTAPDTVSGMNGWVLVTSLSLESTTNFSINNGRPGLIRVERDTTPAFTGAMSVETVSFDTVQVDTVTLTASNLKNRRVNEITFALKADTSYYSFVDTIETGTIAGSVVWTTKEVRITSDSIVGRLVAQSDLIADGALLKVVLRRKTDSAFTSALEVLRFGVNRQSCLGRLRHQGAQVSAEAIIQDSSTTGVDDQREVRKSDAIVIHVEPEQGSLRVTMNGGEVREVMVFDMNGNRLPVQSVERLNASTSRVRLTTPPPSGIYFIGLRGRNEIVYKQFTFIK